MDKQIFGTLFFSIFATVTGVGIVVPLLPVYALGVGASGLYIGLIFGVFSLSRSFFLPFFGRRSDIRGRKPFIVAGLLFYALISVAFLLSHGVISLIVIRFVQGIASAMVLPVVQAYIGDITPRGREGASMGMFNLSLFLGLSLGPLMGGVINDRFSLSAAFASMGILALIGFFLSWTLLPPTHRERVVTRGQEPMPWHGLVKDRLFLGLFFFRFAFTICIGIIWGFLPVLAESEFSLSSSAIGTLVMLGIFISGVFNTPMGWVADRMNKRVMVLSGGILTSLAVFYYGISQDLHDLFLASCLFGVGGGIAMPALMAFAVQKGNQTHAMGSVMSLLTVAHSTGMLCGSLLAGLMMDLFTLRGAFSVGAATMMAGVLGFVIFTSRDTGSAM